MTAICGSPPFDRPHFGTGKDHAFRFWQVVFVRDEAHHDHQTSAHQNARDDPCHKQLSDLQVHQKAVDDKDDRRRDNDANRTASGRGRSRKALVISALNHLRMQHAADCCRGGRIRPRDRGKQTAGADGRHAKAAAHPAQASVGKIGQAFGNPRLGDEVPGQDKQRHRQQGKALRERAKSLCRDICNRQL